MERVRERQRKRQKAQQQAKVDYSKGLKEDGTLEGNDGSYVKLYDYDAIKIEKNEVAVTDEEVQMQIDSLMQSYQTTDQVKDGK